MTDDQVLRVATRARNGAKVEWLLAGDTSGYASPSEADMALMGALACYTQDDEQLARIWAGSGLNRPHLRQKKYIGRTIRRAIANRRFTYDPDYRGR
ncbi:MAG TPA: hypothetical protein VEL12_16570 [Candidatus Nitrosopolaris sp.]|nr:hypothetical protein [Candidatus Nitrosopolaris sp.]